MGDLQDHILDAIRSEGRSLADVERAADAAGVPHGQKASTSQRAAILARLYGWSIADPDAIIEDVLAVTGGTLVDPAARAADESASADVGTPADSPSVGVPPRGRTVEEAIADAEERGKKAKAAA